MAPMTHLITTQTKRKVNDFDNVNQDCDNNVLLEKSMSSTQIANQYLHEIEEIIITACWQHMKQIVKEISLILLRWRWFLSYLQKVVF